MINVNFGDLSTLGRKISDPTGKKTSSGKCLPKQAVKQDQELQVPVGLPGTHQRILQKQSSGDFRAHPSPLPALKEEAFALVVAMKTCHQLVCRHIVHRTWRPIIIPSCNHSDTC